MLGFFSKTRRRQKLLATPIAPEMQRVIKEHVAVFALLSSVEQERVFQAVKVIAAERPFVGCGGLVVTDEIKVTIAAQASILLLGEEGYYFDRVPTIFVYPNHQTTKTRHDLSTAVLVEEEVAIDGQVLEQGEIRLSWDEVEYGGSDPADGENVVLHEFAHHLDRLDGEMGGTPPLPDKLLRERWPQVFDAALAEHRASLAAGREVFLHEEAAENRAELFAYATECFFEQPAELNEYHPELFACLLAFYKADPRKWFV